MPQKLIDGRSAGECFVFMARIVADDLLEEQIISQQRRVDVVREPGEPVKM